MYCTFRFHILTDLHWFVFQPTFYQGDQAPPLGEGGGKTTEPMETNSNEVWWQSDVFVELRERILGERIFIGEIKGF